MKKFLVLILFGISMLYSYTMDFNKETECLVRHIKVYKDPKWVSKIELKDGKKVFFSSPKSMFEFYFQPGRWDYIGVKSEADFKNIIVTDFKTLKPIDAKGAFYIYGANEISPAGDDLVVFENYNDAKVFSSKHSGKRILNFSEVKLSLINLLNGRT